MTFNATICTDCQQICTTDEINHYGTCDKCHEKNEWLWNKRSEKSLSDKLDDIIDDIISDESHQ
jgi:Zn finger protein HypA/HybF involved in hydrogenase expression